MPVESEFEVENAQFVRPEAKHQENPTYDNLSFNSFILKLVYSMISILFVFLFFTHFILFSLFSLSLSLTLAHSRSIENKKNITVNNDSYFNLTVEKRSPPNIRIHIYIYICRIHFYN